MLINGGTCGQWRIGLVPVISRLPSKQVSGRLTRRHPKQSGQVKAILHMRVHLRHNVAVDRIIANTFQANPYIGVITKS
jgi:hypothetical protein